MKKVSAAANCLICYNIYCIFSFEWHLWAVSIYYRSTYLLWFIFLTSSHTIACVCIIWNRLHLACNISVSISEKVWSTKSSVEKRNLGLSIQAWSRRWQTTPECPPSGQHWATTESRTEFWWGSTALQKQQKVAAKVFFFLPKNSNRRKSNLTVDQWWATCPPVTNISKYMKPCE